MLNCNLMKRALRFYSFLLSVCSTVQIDEGDRSVTAIWNSKCARVHRCAFVNDESVYCLDVGLTFVPQCMENIELLDMSGNRLVVIDASDFPDHFKSLQILILRNTLLRMVYGSAFLNLSDLRELDLSENLLKTITNATFENLELLERLNLSVNRIRRLDAGSFMLPKLRVLDLSDGILEIVDDEAFSKLPALQWLNLQGNRLKTLSLDGDVPNVLVGGGNPWNCDCGFLLLSKKVNGTVDKNFSCIDSERNRRFWTELSYESECEEKNYLLKAAKEDEKNARTENTTELIVDVYGYVLVGFAFLVILCCWCSNKDESSDPDPDERDATQTSSPAGQEKDSAINQLTTNV